MFQMPTRLRLRIGLRGDMHVKLELELCKRTTHRIAPLLLEDMDCRTIGTLFIRLELLLYGLPFAPSWAVPPVPRFPWAHDATLHSCTSVLLISHGYSAVAVCGFDPNIQDINSSSITAAFLQVQQLLLLLRCF